jgi:hypothetical protein
MTESLATGDNPRRKPEVSVLTSAQIRTIDKGDSAPRYEGRLELTWTDKNLRLLAHDDGSCEWLTAGASLMAAAPS